MVALSPRHTTCQNQAVLGVPTLSPDMSVAKMTTDIFNRLSRAHERYRQTTDDRQTDGR